MATLAAQILIDIQVLVASAHLVDATNQRDTDTAINTTLLTRVCEIAAAKVASMLGSVDSTDTLAVDLGVRWAILSLQSSYSMLQTNGDTRAALIAEMQDLAVIRGLEADVQIGSPDFGWVDSVYPGSTNQQIDNPDNHD